MKKYIPCLFPILLLAFACHAFAVTPEEKAASCRMDIAFRGVTASEALQYVGKQAGVKVHYTLPETGDTKVTLLMVEIPASEAFNYIAAQAKLDVAYKDDGVYFTPRKQAP